MKSQRRHELQHNVLESKLRQFGGFIKRNANTISWVILIAAVAILISVWAWRKHTESARQPQIEFEYLMARINARDANMDEVLTRLKTLASQDSNRKIAAAASLAAAASYADQALMARDELTRSQQETSAAEMYNNVISRFSDIPDQVAKAYFGLGELEAGKGEIEKARSDYSQALKLAPNGYPVKDLASRALANLDKLAAPILMTTTAPFEPSTAPGTWSLTQPKDGAKPDSAIPNVQGPSAAPANQDSTSGNRDVPIPRKPQ